MKALVLVAKDQPLMYEDLNMPAPTEGEVVVSLKAAALNHRDVWIFKGLYAGIKYPIVLGSDGAGVLDDGRAVIINAGIGWGNNPKAQSKDFKVLGLPDNGTFAEYVKVPAVNIHDKPAHLTFEEAAALPLAGLTAYRALMTRAKAKRKERVLISGIGGGVALFAMQFALAAGCEVWVTSGSDNKIERAIQYGAKGGVNYTSGDWVKSLLARSGGFDVIVDSSISDSFGEFIGLCNPGGRIVIYGATTLGSINNVNPRPFFWKQISLLGSTMGSPKDFEAMLALVNKHQIKPIVDKVFALKDGNAAMRYLNNSQQFGKVVLKCT